MEDQCIGTMFPNFVLIAPFLACLHASKEGKNTKHMGSDVKKADFAVCEQQILQTSLRVRADKTGCPPCLIYCSLIPKHEISEISLCKDRIFTCRLLYLSFPLMIMLKKSRLLTSGSGGIYGLTFATI